MWMMHPNFPKVVEDAWSKENPLPRAVSDFTTKVRKWNNEVFGNLFTRKMRVLARLGGVQKALANNPSDFQIGLEKQLTEEYAMIMLQEEEFWALKLRLNTALYGDCNMGFFHLSTVVRRHINKIRCLMDETGD